MSGLQARFALGLLFAWCARVKMKTLERKHGSASSASSMGLGQDTLWVKGLGGVGLVGSLTNVCFNF